MAKIDEQSVKAGECGYLKLRSEIAMHEQRRCEFAMLALSYCRMTTRRPRRQLSARPTRTTSIEEDKWRRSRPVVE